MAICKRLFEHLLAKFKYSVQNSNLTLFLARRKIVREYFITTPPLLPHQTSSESK
jgi:hypothetical protein